ncbi:MAG: TetR/AcrR family transcriptional regulator [Clostridia bacterium]|nr:TetR/AcrR family transcriptional regulator [Clostridia bacterium]
MKGNQRIALTKRLLQEAIIRLLETKPIDKISVTELCNESGINRATFYRHYNTPRDLLLEMEIEFAETINLTYNAAMIRDVSKCAEELCNYLYSNSKLLKIFIRNNSEEDLCVLLNGIFYSFIERNDFIDLSAVDEASLKLISSYITGGGYFMMKQWLMEDIQKDPKEVADLILKFMNYTASFLSQSIQ